MEINKAVNDSNIVRNTENVTSNTETSVESSSAKVVNQPEFQSEMECVDSTIAKSVCSPVENIEQTNKSDNNDSEKVHKSTTEITDNNDTSKTAIDRNLQETETNYCSSTVINKTTPENDEIDYKLVVERKNITETVDSSMDQTSLPVLLHPAESFMMNTSNLPNCGATIVNDSSTHEELLNVTAAQESEIQTSIEMETVLTIGNEPLDIEMLSSTVEKNTTHAEIDKSLENNLSKPAPISVTETAKMDATLIAGKTMKNLQVQTAVNSLSVIASAYDSSDSESEEVDCIYDKNKNQSDGNEMEVQITKEYRNKAAVESSDEDSSSDESSSSAASSSSSDVESDESNDSDSETKNDSTKKDERNRRYKSSQEKESKGEFDNLPPIEDLKISVPEVLCDPLGEVGWMVEQMVVVRPKPGKPTLNLDTILFVERGRRVLGRIFDVFGQVSEPHYCVRFNSTEHIKESDIKVGMTVYFCPNTEYTSVVFLQDLLKMKVTDELGDDEHPEFSDDEEERAYFAALKQKQNKEKPKSSSEVPQKRQRTGQESGWKANHPWSTGRKQQKPGKNYNKSDWSGNSQQQNSCPPNNLWHYPTPYANNPWPAPSPNSYQGNSWPAPCPQNSYGFSSEQFGNRQINPRGNARPFFRPPHSFQSAPNPYTQNSSSYAQQSNPARYPGPNFPWRAQQCSRQPAMSWPITPPPPPPPPGI